MQKFLRKCGKWTDILPIAYIITIVLIIIGQSIGYVLSAALTSSEPWISIALQYFAFIGIWAVGLVPLLFKANRPMIKALAPNRKGNTWQFILIGAGIGFGMNALCALLSILFKDIAISFSCFEPLKLLFILFCVFVQSGAEELMCRWYLLQKLARRYKNIWIAIVGNALLFVLLHLANPGVNFWGCAQILIIGVMFSLMSVYYHSLWGAMLVHTLWNFTQNIIFGLPNSGIVSPYSIFHLDAASSGFFFDPGFGIEGTPGACLIITIVTIVMFLDIRKRKLQPLDIWKEAEEEAELASTQKAS